MFCKVLDAKETGQSLTVAAPSALCKISGELRTVCASQKPLESIVNQFSALFLEMYRGVLNTKGSQCCPAQTLKEKATYGAPTAPTPWCITTSPATCHSTCCYLLTWFYEALASVS